MATLKLIFGLAIFGLVILVGLKVIPPYFSNYELEDAIKTEAMQSTYSTRYGRRHSRCRHQAGAQLRY